MPIIYEAKKVTLYGNCEVDLAEELGDWLIDNQNGKVCLKELTFAHSAIFQVILQYQARVEKWPSQHAGNWLMTQELLVYSPAKFH